MKKINYDFTIMKKCMQSIKISPNSSNLNNLKNELNRFFKDSKCMDVIYTKNTDKLFFGMCVMPVIST